MHQLTPAMLTPWQNFYVILGSSAGALTGLQFVVITLVTQARAAGSIRNIYAFATPTVIHFCTALLISAFMTAPWQGLGRLALCLGACGVVGIAYSIRTVWHARRAQYQPTREDWAWYLMIPLLGYMVLFGAAVLLRWNAVWAFEIVAGDSLLFLFTGVHNSWDTVTFIAVEHGTRAAGEHAKDQADSQTS